MSDDWKNSSIHLKMIVRDPGDTENAHRQLGKYLKEGKLDLEVDILVVEPEVKDFSATIKKASMN